MVIIGSKVEIQGKGAQVALLLADPRVDTALGEKDGYTALHAAAFQGRATVARMLLDHGFAVDDRHADGYTPLHRALWGRERRHVDTARVLIHDGRAALRGANGRTLWQMAATDDMRALLREAGVEPNSEKSEI